MYSDSVKNIRPVDPKIGYFFIVIMIMIFIILNLSNILARRRHRIMSSESIENILYYKDCNHKQRPTMRPLRQPVQRPQQQQCKMFCTMCCGDQCVNTPQMGTGGQNQVIESRILPISPNMQNQKRKIRAKLQPPIPERRGMSFTRDNIKSLIAKDEDIRKILKDLVRVTMQKVDLMELLKNRNAEKRNSEVSNESESDNIL